LDFKRGSFTYFKDGRVQEQLFIHPAGSQETGGCARGSVENTVPNLPYEHTLPTISSPDCDNINSLEVQLDLKNSPCLQSVMSDQYSRVDDVSKGASEEESGDSSGDGGTLVRGTARDPIHNNVFFVERDDVAAKAISLVGGSSKEDNNEYAAPIKINYTEENLPSSYQSSRPKREQTDPRSLSRSDLLHLIVGNEGLDESQKEGLFRVLENYVSHMTT
jgi:hypothetical protein